MNSIYLIISVINIVVLMFLEYTVTKSYFLDSQNKKYYRISIAVVILTILAEIIVSLSEIQGPNFRVIHLLSNAFGFALSPLIALYTGKAIYKTNDFFDKIVWAISCVNIFIAMASIFYPLIFTVNMNNEYSRGSFFIFYIIAYLLNIVYLFKKTLQAAKIYQNDNKFVLFFILFFVICGTSIQVLLPSYRLSWLFVTFSMCLYYMYCCELYYQIDLLTGLLSHSIFENYLDNFDKEFKSVAFIDIDNFKTVNDSFGHQYGDWCLKKIAEVIRNIYEEYGLCFRTGGDEFCILLKTNDTNLLEKLLERLNNEIKILKLQDDKVPSVSLGYKIGIDNLLDAINESEKNMYKIKRSKQID